MSSVSLPILVAFFWYGLSIVFYLIGFMARSNRTKELLKGRPPRNVVLRVIVERLFLIAVGLVGVFGLAMLLGLYNGQLLTINLAMLAGSVVGLVVSALIVGIPRLPRKGSGGKE